MLNFNCEVCKTCCNVSMVNGHSSAVSNPENIFLYVYISTRYYEVKCYHKRGIIKRKQKSKCPYHQPPSKDVNTFKTLAGKVSHSLRKRGTRSLFAQKKKGIQMVYLFLRRTSPKSLSSFGQLYGSDVILEEESRDLCPF